MDELEARLAEIRQNIALLEWEKRRAGLDDNNDISVHAAEMSAKPVDPNGSLYTKGTISLVDQLSRVKYEEELLTERYRKQVSELGDLFETAQTIEKQNNELKHIRDLFDAVRQRLDQKNMERNRPGSIEVLTRAFVPSKPHHGRQMLFTAIALVVGLGLSIGVAILPGRKAIR